MLLSQSCRAEKQPPEVFYIKKVFLNHRKIPTYLFFHKVPKETSTQEFSGEFCGIFKNTVFTENLRAGNYYSISETLTLHVFMVSMKLHLVFKTPLDCSQSFSLSIENI